MGLIPCERIILGFKHRLNHRDRISSNYIDRFFHFVEECIDRIENLKIKPLYITLYLCTLIVIRDLLEQWFFSEYFNIQRLMHHFLFAFAVLIAGILIISYLGKIDVYKTTLIVSVGSVLIILPPLFDHLILLRKNPYEYLLPNEFIFNFSTFYIFTHKAGLGISIELGAILVLACFYILIKTRSLIRTFMTGICLYAWMGLSATPRLYLPLPEMTNSIIWQSRHLIYFSFYSGLLIILSLMFLLRLNRAIPEAIFKEVCSFRSLHFIFMTSIGIYFNKDLNFLVFPDFLYIIINILLILVLWMGTVLINNVYDLSIDKISNPNRPLVIGAVTPATYLNLSSVLSIPILLLSLILGIVPFILTLLFSLSSFAYSMPPLRLRQRLFSTLFIGWGSSLAFFIGYFNRTNVSEISIDPNVLLLSLLIFIAFSLGPMTKDLKDYQGDLMNGVRTVFTVFGKKRGKKIVSICLGLSLLTPVILFHGIKDIAFLLLAASHTSMFFYFRERLIITYLGYGTVFLYCLIKITGYI